MKITIPKHIMGSQIEGSLERVLAGSVQTQTPVNPSQDPVPQPLAVNADLSKYIQVGINGINGKPTLISPFELENYGGLNYEDTHVKLLENGLYMPTPKIFMTYFNGVMASFNGKGKLFHADGSEVRKELVQDMYLHLTKNHKNVYGRNNVGAWTWLNAKFVSGTGSNDIYWLESVTRHVKGQGNRSNRTDLILTEKN